MILFLKFAECRKIYVILQLFQFQLQIQIMILLFDV